MTTWRGWWAVNDRALLPERSSDPGPLTPTPDDAAFAEGRRVRRALAVRDEILPTLRTLLAPEAKRVNDLLRRTGLIALGKLAQTEGDIELLLHWLVEPRAGTAVREAAALGAGLLCRGATEDQFEPEVLDSVRTRLLRVIADASAPDPVRATCAISVGLLGDQPFGTGIHRSGRLVTHELWRNLEPPGARADLVVSLLTALGMQPADGAPEGMRHALMHAVYGRPLNGRRFDDLERGHALTTLTSLGGSEAVAVTLGTLGTRRVPREVQRAALIAVGRMAPELSRNARSKTAAALRRSLPRLNDALSRGLAFLAVGRLVSAQVIAGDPVVRDLKSLWTQLVSEASNGSSVSRGFALLGVGLAARTESAVDEQPAALRRMRAEVERLLVKGLENERGDPDLRGAHAVAAGIMRAQRAIPHLLRIVEDRTAADALRSDAAVALGHVGRGGPEVVRGLHLALADSARPKVQAGAALGLSLLTGPASGRRLLRDLEQARGSTDVRRLTEPLGHLGDPAFARPLVDYVRSEDNAAFPRALMIVALGNLGDPEPRPSLARLGRDANYPDAPPAFRDTLFTR